MSDAMHDDPPAALLCPFLVPVFRVHLLQRKVTVFILKPTVVHSEQFAIDLAFHLLHEIIDRVAVDEGPFFCIMRMQIEVERKAVIFDKVVGQLFDGVYGRLLPIVGVHVIAV